MFMAGNSSSVKHQYLELPIIAIFFLTIATTFALAATPTTISVKADKNSVVVGEKISLTATIEAGNGIVSGTINFYDTAKSATTPTYIGQVKLKAEDKNVATLTLDNLEVGKHSILAQYQGDSTYSSSSSLNKPIVIEIVKEK